MSFNDTFTQFPTLDTERLLLRQLQPADAADLYGYYADPEVFKYLDWCGPTSIEHAHEVIATWNRWYTEKRIIRWGMVFKATQRLIGTIFFGDFIGQSRADLGYELARSVWKQGIMTEALQAVIPFGFKSIGLHRIQAIVNPDNLASIHVLKKFGFVAEGCLRAYEYHYVRKDFNDVIMLSLLRHEYRQTV